MSHPRIDRPATVCLLILFALAALPVSADGQPADWRGMTVVQALERLRADGLRLVYSDELVPVDLVVASEPTATAPREILDQLLAPHRLAVREGSGGRLLIVRVSASAPGTLRGRVVQSGGFRLPAARIVVPAAGAQTSSDREGRFELSLPAGTYNVTVTAPGYVTRSFAGVPIGPAAPAEVEWSLELLEIVHESIRVTGERSATAPAADPIGLERELLDRAPSLMNDPYEVVGRLPGVAEAETTAALNIRGGRGDETLLLLDGLELYQPYHVKDLGGGLLTVIDSATIGHIDYFGGAFPAQYGNRVSGVLEMTTVSATGGAAGELTLSRGLFRGVGLGRIDGGRGDWLVSVRAGDPEFLFESWVSESIYRPSYFDLLGKVTYRVGQTVVSGHVLTSIDENRASAEFDPAAADGRVDARYDSQYLWLSADTVWNPGLLSRTVLAWGTSDVDRNVADLNLAGAVSDQREFEFIELKQDWRAVPSVRHNLRFGFDVRWQDARYDYRSILDGPAPPGAEPPVSREASPSGAMYSLYVSDTFRVHPTVLLEFGLRHDAETYTGLDDSITSPRANIAWSPNARTTVRAGWGRYHQFQRIYELQIEDGVEEFFGAETSEHRQLSVEHEFRTSLRGRFGLFEKSQHGVRPWFENLFDPMVLVPEARPDRVMVDPDRARSVGVEATVQGWTALGLNWSASYTLSSVEDEFDDGDEPRLWDQRHAIDVGLQYSLRGRWWFALTGLWHSGRPTTAVLAGEETAPDGSPVTVPVLGPRNGERYPSYARLDIRAERLFRVGSQGIRLFVNVANLLDGDNICCTDSFELVTDAGGASRYVPHERQGLGRTFTLGATWQFGDRAFPN